MKTYSRSFDLQSKDNPSFTDVTSKIHSAVSESKIKDGIIVVYSQHTTCSIIIQEESHDTSIFQNSTLFQDLIDVLENIVPTLKRKNQYLHPGPILIDICAGFGETLTECHNTDGHLRSMFFGRSESIPLINGEVMLGDFGQVYFADFDQIRPRERIFRVQIIGE